MWMERQEYPKGLLQVLSARERHGPAAVSRGIDRQPNTQLIM
jgi:hypothetical protein